MWNYVVWPLWLGAIAVSFAVLEGIAIVHDRWTLSRFTWELTTAWPPLPWIAGFLVGFLTCHFWWGGIVSFAPVVRVLTKGTP